MNGTVSMNSHQGKVILVTFAGRQDRMEILTWYARAAIERGIVDEWHVWDFARNDSDRRWLRQQFPLVRMTPSEGLEYFNSNHLLRAGTEPSHIEFSVAASGDVHIGLKRISGTGASYEIILGGWYNNRSAIRALPNADLLLAVDQRGSQETVLIMNETKSLLPETGFVHIAVECRADGLTATLDGRKIIEYKGKIEPGEFEIMYRTGYGCNAEWRFNAVSDSRVYLFKSGRQSYLHMPPQVSAPRYLSFYAHYGRQRHHYENDVFLKCDDDIVYIDLDALEQFVAFRRAHHEYFLLSANVVNNGVCAYFQQQYGAIPKSLMDLELPPGGGFGSLWKSSQKAAALHDFFLHNPNLFREVSADTIEWNQRLSINFIGFLGKDLVHIPDVMFDDEHYLCYQSRVRSRRPNAIYLPLVVAHLSFFSQDEGLDCKNVISNYADFARSNGITPQPKISCA